MQSKLISRTRSEVSTKGIKIFRYDLNQKPAEKSTGCSKSVCKAFKAELFWGNFLDVFFDTLDSFS
jgi:hypothetical protein